MIDNDQEEDSQNLSSIESINDYREEDDIIQNIYNDLTKQAEQINNDASNISLNNVNQANEEVKNENDNVPFYDNTSEIHQDPNDSLNIDLDFEDWDENKKRKQARHTPCWVM